MNRYAILVAGGSGTRMGSPLAKQFMLLGGKPVLMHSIQRFHEAGKEIIIVVVLPSSEHVYWKGLCKQHKMSLPHMLVAGGESRFHSVKNGLEVVPDDSLVAVHDGVRPFLTRELIELCYHEAADHGNAIPCITVQESLRRVGESGSERVDRNEYMLVQTPQCFRAGILKQAYAAAGSAEFSDDAGVVEAAGETIRIVHGIRENIKITTPADLHMAEGLYRAAHPER